MRKTNHPPDKGGQDSSDEKSEGNNILQFRNPKAEKQARPTRFSVPMGENPLPAPGGKKWGAAGIEEKIASVAALGLDEAEIEAWLGDSLEADPLSQDQFDAAVDLGRVKGSARIKVIQYEAALQGKVAAQAKVLARLEGGLVEEGEGGEREIEVVQEIIAPEENGESAE